MNRSVGGAKALWIFLPASPLSVDGKLLPASFRLGGDCLIGGQLCTGAAARGAFGGDRAFLSDKSENLEPKGLEPMPPPSRCTDFQVL